MPDLMRSRKKIADIERGSVLTRVVIVMADEIRVETGTVEETKVVTDTADATKAVTGITEGTEVLTEAENDAKADQKVGTTEETGSTAAEARVMTNVARAETGLTENAVRMVRKIVRTRSE